MEAPDVSVVTPAYEAAAYVERALESVRRQTVDGSRIEHVVVDDASTDDTAAVVEAFDAPYLRLLENERNLGATGACNRGIEAARGDYVVVLDADDEFRPTLIETLAGVLDDRPAVDFAYCDYYEQFLDGERVVVDTEDVTNTIRIGVMHRRERLEAFGLYDPEMRFSEYDLLFRYLEAGVEGHRVPEPLFVYHRRRDSITGDAAWVEAARAELREKFGDDLRIRGYEIE